MSFDEFTEKMENYEGLYRLNLAIEEERDYYLESVGGEENLKKNYPILYKSYIKSSQTDEISDKAEEENDIFHFEVYGLSDEGETDCKCNKEESELYSLKACIAGGIIDENSSLINPEQAQSFYVSINGKIYDPDSPRSAYLEIHDSYKQVNRIDNCYQSKKIYTKGEFNNRLIKCKITVNIYDKNNKVTPYVYIQTKKFGNVMEYAIDNIHIDAPVSKHPDTHQIRILYGRTAQNLDNPDYIYKSNNADMNNNKLWTIVPIKGKVELKKIHTSDDYYSFDKLTIPDEGEAMTRPVLQYGDVIWKTYRNDLNDKQLQDKLNDGKHFKVTKGDGGVEILNFDFFNADWEDGKDRRYDWVQDIDKASTDNRERICYLDGGFAYDIFKKNKDGEIIELAAEYQVVCRSVEYNRLREMGFEYYTFYAGSGTIYLPPVRLWWGCHARDTQIRLADGSLKRADKIKIGDSLIVYGERILTVNNIYYGDEEELAAVKLEDENQIQVSKGHPLLRDDGTRVDVMQLSKGDRILAESGKAVTVSEVVLIPYNDVVYNFTFEGEEEGNYVVANGLYSGDFYAQNLQGDRKIVPTPEQEALGMELDRLADQLNEN